jgi:hypothetical protein
MVDRAAVHARFLELAERISFPGLEIEIVHETASHRELAEPVHCGHFLRVVCREGRCNFTGEPLSWKGRKFRLIRHMTDMEFVNTAFMAVLTALEHETREQFRVDGVALMDSHRDLDLTLAFMDDGGGGHGRED